MSTPPDDPGALVLALAAQQGQAWIDQDAAQRIAAGAAAAIAAVVDTLREMGFDPFDVDAGDFAGVLEALAPIQTPTPREPG